MKTMKAMKQLKYGTLVSNSSFGGTMRRNYLHPAAVLCYPNYAIIQSKEHII